MSVKDEFGRELGSGGTGTVYEGPDNTVYKVTTGDELANSDLLREFFTLTRLQNKPDLPVPQIIDAGSLEDGARYIQMAKIEGDMLTRILPSMPKADVKSVQTQINKIFNQLSEIGIFHGDAGGLDNYLISYASGAPRVHLIDFVEGGRDPSGQKAKDDAKTINQILNRYL